MKHLFLTTIAVALGLSGFSKDKPVETITNDDVILHAWCWSFNTIKENMKNIADAGYKYVQTPPAQNCIIDTKGDEGGGNQLYGHGRWYYHYQPVDWKIGNYQVGTREDFIAMCNEAKKYGIKVIVDVLPNHTAVDVTKVSDDLNAAVGGHENLYHAAGFTEIVDYNDRLQCTTGQMGGLPDVNTENPDFQYYYMTYVNDLLNCGARGFRYDTAKHIGLPSDPLDPKSKQNDFWDVATGRKAVKGLSLALPMDSWFVHGEVLQDKNVKEKEYGQYLNLTASSYGHVLRNVLSAGDWGVDSVKQWHHPVSPYNLVTWVESHDTYCNAHESAGLTNEQIRMGWVFLAARQNGTPLFYSRPNNSSPDNVWGDNVVGVRGNGEFMHPEVVAVNKFRRQMHGQPEYLYFSTDNKVAEVCRGKKGAALVNITGEDAEVEMETSLPNGKYKDKVHGTEFVVKNGLLKGTLKAFTSYILVKK